ncbi:MAG: zinc ribbon domain-containing protein [Pseudomonadota bacterium]
MGKIASSISSFRDRLFKFDDREPLSKLSLAVIIALDIFILTILFQGLYDHTRQLTSPDEYVPFACKQVFIHDDWTESNRFSELQTMALSGYNNISYRYEGLLERADTEIMHPTCKGFYQSIKKISNHHQLNPLFIERQKLSKQKNKLNSSFSKDKDVYDTSLLENIADKRADNDNLTSISSSSRELSTKIDKVSQRILSIEAEINAHQMVQILWASTSQDNQIRKQIVTDYKKFEFWYVLRKLAWQMVFMLPVFFVFYFWSSRSAKKHHTIQTLISSHLLVVASIPILLRIIELVLDLIPRHFLKNLFKVLESLHLIAIWHYFVIFASVGASLFLIYLIQRKLFNQHRIYQKRLMKGACYSCGLKLPDNADNCPFCGKPQLKTCSNCQADTYATADFCTRCGTKF